MRSELELIETIDRYLQGLMNAAEKAEFEKRINSDPKLKKEVELQKDVVNGVKRLALKQKITKAYRKYSSGKNFLNLGGALVVVAVASSIIMLYTSKLSHHPNDIVQNLPEYNEEGTKEWSTADKYIPAQNFNLNTSKDTVIQTKAGMIIAVPAHCFLGDDGKPVTGPVELEVKEALDPASIMRAGLSTKSGDRLLQSAGMFYLNGSKDGKSLKIDSTHGIYVRVPSDSVKKGMMAFKGKRMPDGSIDWVNPKPLLHDLVPVNIHKLDFYPPGYIDSLAEWGYDSKNKKFTDSLYYSFASLFGMPETSAPLSSVLADSSASQDKVKLKDEEINFRQFGDSMVCVTCGINPAKIKAIWSDDFQNTIISTREFEERLRYIHESKYGGILDLYVNNLDKNMCSIDSMAANQLSGDMQKTFLAFAARGDGKVKINSSLFQKLKDFYETKSRLFTEAVTKAQRTFFDKQNKLDSVSNSKQNADLKRMTVMRGEEYKANLKEAARQIGDPDSIGRTDKDGYAVLCTGTGWINLDAYVWESTIDRTTLNYTSPINGKKAVIKYLPMSVKVNDYEKYDELFIYLLPDKLNSFMRVTGNKGMFTEKLDELFKYKMECIAYKGNNAFYYAMDNAEAKAYDNINLQPISIKQLDVKLNALGSRSQQKDMEDEVKSMQYEAADKKRENKIQRMNDLTFRVQQLLFPCFSRGELQGQ